MFVLGLASVQGANPWTAARPGYFEYANMWDARWYQIIWLAGYPADPPLTAGARVAERAGAFLPAYPALVGVRTRLAVPWNVASVAVAVAAGLGAALVFH